MSLTIVPAGAGAGKTHRIKTVLTKWVQAGDVRPDRILAVTFTEAAAGELRERIRASLLDAGMIDAALGVERAYVSTIHGLGLRVLTEHAFAAGASPQPRHLSDAERDLLIRQALAQCEVLTPVMRDPERFGYAANYASDTTIEDTFRGKVLQVIDLLRGLGDAGTDPALVDAACARLHAVYGETLPDGAPLVAALQEACAAMLAMFPDGAVASATSASAKDSFRKDLANLRASGRLGHDWKLWGKLREMRLSKRGAPTPEGYDAHAEAVMQAAARIIDHPGPRDDALLHLRCLLSGAQAIMSDYAARKRSLGVIDFADMVADTERLLRTNPQVLDALLAEVDCVIVDEFQDTNPVMFALLWRLAEQAKRTLLVGDVKQSIMGFNGADPRLTEALVEAFPANVDPLPQNWRSDPRIMALVNHIGAGLFPHYTRLAPTRDETGQPFLEMIRTPDGRRAKKPRPEVYTATRIRSILTDGDQITDRHTGELRPAHPSDIAVLVGRHSVAAKYAETLTAFGIPVRISTEGWHDSRAVACARHAIALAADPADSHAALCLLTLGPAALDLATALRDLTDGALLDRPELRPILALAPLAHTAPMAVLVPAALAASGIRDWADHLPDAAQARADLLRLEHEASEFDAAHTDTKAAAGFHGNSPKVFLGWLAAQTNNDRHPDPSSGAALGVEIVTWHASKGREWPITVVAELDREVGEWPGTTSAEFTDFSDLSRVLDSASILHTPRLDVPERLERFTLARRPAAEAGTRNLLYVALTRARDRLILEWPDYAFEKETPTAAALLVAETGLTVNAGSLSIAGETFPMRVQMAPGDGAEPDAPLPTFRFGIPRALPHAPHTEWRQRPSAQGATPLPRPARDLPLGPAHMGDEAFAAATEKGTAWHLAFRTLAMRPDLAHRLNAATGLDAATLAAIAAQATALREWLQAEGFPTLHAELPVQIDNPDGSQLNGVIDLLAAGSDGIAIIDHKTGSGGFAGYWPQLAAYSRAAALVMGQPVRKVAIHWMNMGTLSVLDLETADV
ncbi:UvrD-helicase domain-containing protein [Cereibacter sp. SYSU M97828]|nr:UvrD-helicase domain-containing protein [Cereibacter flavus]